MKIIIFCLLLSSKILYAKTFVKSFNKITASSTSYFARCVQQAKYRNSSIKGSIDLRITFMPNGSIDHIGVIENTNYQDRTLARCLYNRVRKLKYPKTGYRKKITVNKTFNFI